MKVLIIQCKISKRSLASGRSLALEFEDTNIKLMNKEI